MPESSPDDSSNIDVWLQDAVDTIQSSIPSDATRTVLHHLLMRAAPDVMVEQESALALDERFMSTFGVSGILRKEYDNNKSEVLFLNRLISLASLLRDTDPDRTRDICAALCMRAGADPSSLSDTHQRETLRWILGDKRFDQWRKKLGKKHEKYIQRLEKILDRSEDIRRKFLFALDRFATMPVQLLAGAIARQGWVYLAEEGREITDHEWWQRQGKEAINDEIATQVQGIAVSGLERSARHHMGVAKRTKNVQTKKKHTGRANFFRGVARATYATAQANRKNAATVMKDTKEYFATHPDAPPARKLVDILDWQGWQKKLEVAKGEGHAARLGTLQKQIALDVFFHVERMDSGRKNSVSSAKENRSGIPDYVRGFPTEIVHRKEGSCFGGLWLTASLLLKCGITPEQLRFCHVNKDHDGQIGAHAELLLLTENKEILTIDFGFNVCGRELRLGGSTSGRTHLEMQELLNGTRTDPVIWNADPYFTQRWKYPQSMIVMPVIEGFAHVHLWHTGIELLHEGKIKEAKEAFHLAEMLCPQNPDVLYYLGVVASQSGDLKSAKAYLKDAIAVFKGHIRSHEALGKIALLEGDEGEALRRFTLVATDESSIWGDDTFKKEAAEYIVAYKKAHPEEAEEPLTYQI